jgi:orotidine-5'-phosphate decarboxylase
MNRQQLFELIQRKKSFLCVGLDSDINKIPKHLLEEEDPVFEFNKQIIEATIDFAIAYKPNLAFYESRGIKGMQSLERTMSLLRTYGNDVFTIADAKRGDIGNTSTQYARSVFNEEATGFSFDAITVAPYMGEDSVRPFLEFPGKWAIILVLTSNKGADDFQFFRSEDHTPLFKQVLSTTKQWGNTDNTMYVVGATRAEMLTEVRAIVPDHFLLVPGVGAQGGSLQEVAGYGMNNRCGLLVNASRSILFASSGSDFALKAADESLSLQQQMKYLLEQHGLL